MKQSSSKHKKKVLHHITLKKPVAPQNESKKSAKPHPYTWSKNPYSWSYLGKKICATAMRIAKKSWSYTQLYNLCEFVRCRLAKAAIELTLRSSGDLSPGKAFRCESRCAESICSEAQFQQQWIYFSKTPSLYPWFFTLWGSSLYKMFLPDPML